MAIELRGLKATDPVVPHQKWRCTLTVDPLEPFLIARFDTLLDKWATAINTGGMAYRVSPFTKEGGIMAKLVAVVDIRVMPLATQEQGTVGQLGAALDDCITGLDVSAIRLAPEDEGSAAGEAARNAILTGADEKGIVNSAGESLGAVVAPIGNALGAVYKPITDILILAGGILVVYFVVRK